MSCCLYETRSDGRVALITLNRPDRNNAWNFQLGLDLLDCYKRAEQDPKVSVVVLTGSGKSFCVGADMDLLSGGVANPRVQLPPDHAVYPTNMRTPVIAAVNGACAGLGFSLALACDIRFIAEGASISCAFSQRGLIAEHGTSHLLPRLVGTGKALEMLLSSRKYTAKECTEMGVFQRCFPKSQVVDEALKFATEMAVKVPPSSLAVIKQQVYQHPRMELRDAMHQSNALMNASATKKNPDHVEGVQSYLKRRTPNHLPYDGSRPVVALARNFFVNARL
eukprot:TRINITY_DN1698_c9_g1_i1.p1 TRINITY_DN1698_c9_g1~~TRINITY_DN1698_c9_g1_i1.p1  ORF type:complete len:279 (+),score=95.77 TRINITY_DN1698_c9_g1_i1:73-909(+)